MLELLGKALCNLAFDLKALTIRSKVTAKGRYELRLIGPDGQVKEILCGSNLIVTTGKNGIADLCLASPTIPKPSHMAIGTGVTGPAAGDTTLGTENCTRVASAPTRGTNVLTFVATFAAANGTGAVTEAGIFTQASVGGTLYSRIVFAAINKGASDSLQLTWTWTIG